MLEIPIIRNYYYDGNIFEKRNVIFQPGLTVLIGCNGSGKTTMLKQIKITCENRDIPVISFDNYKEGGSQARSRWGFYGQFDRLSEALVSSEGEQINMNLAEQAAKIGRFIRDNSLAQKVVILFDALDSGLSIDYIVEFKELLIKTIIEDCNSKGITVYIIASANEYELARGEQCMVAAKCKYVSIKSYDRYRKIIIETRKKKNERYGHNPYEFT